MNRDRYRRTAGPLSVETTGKTVDEAVQTALSRLRARRDEVEVKVIQEGRGGFLGLVGAREARVRVEKRESGSAPRRDVRPERGPQRGPEPGGYSRGRVGTRRPQDDLDRLEEELRARRDQRRAAETGRGRELGVGPEPRVDGRGQEATAEGREEFGSGRGGRGGRERRRPPARTGTGGSRVPGGDIPSTEYEDRPRRQEAPPAPSGTSQGVSEGYPDPRTLAEFTRELLGKMGYEASVEARYVDDAYEVRVEAGENDAVLIGRKGETLDALQHVLAKMVSRGQVELLRVRVDVSEYRQRRTTELADQAIAWAQQVRETGQGVITEPLPAAERRTIHRALAEVPDVTTQALGDGLIKRVWIGPQGSKPEPETEQYPAAREEAPSVRTSERAPAAEITEEPISLVDSWNSAPSKTVPTGDAPADEWGRRPKPARGRRR